MGSATNIAYATNGSVITVTTTSSTWVVGYSMSHQMLLLVGFGVLVVAVFTLYGIYRSER